MTGVCYPVLGSQEATTSARDTSPASQATRANRCIQKVPKGKMTFATPAIHALSPHGTC
jgi:hypothetical protein